MIGAQFLKEPLPIVERPWDERSTLDRRAVVRELVQYQDKSYTEAARILGTSRNAIGGVMTRAAAAGEPIVSTRMAKMREQRDRDPKNRKKEPTHRPGDNVRAEAIQRRLEKAGHAAQFNTAPVYLVFDIPVAGPPNEKAWEPLPGSLPVSLEHHTTGCRWPIGADLPYAFCNEEPVEGSPYCAAHTAMGTRPLTRNEKKLARVPRPKGAVAATAWE